MAWSRFEVNKLRSFLFLIVFGMYVRVSPPPFPSRPVSPGPSYHLPLPQRAKHYPPPIDNAYPGLLPGGSSLLDVPEVRNWEKEMAREVRGSSCCRRVACVCNSPLILL